MPRPKRTPDPLVLSILDIPRGVIAARIFGEDTQVTRNKVALWTGGRRAITLAEFWELYKAFPHIDLERSMQDLYDRRLIAAAQQNMLTSVKPCARDVSTRPRKSNGQFRQTSDSPHTASSDGS